MNVPFVDLKAQYLTIKNDIDATIQDCILNTHFIGGDKVKNFEKEFAAYLGLSHVMACANGTDSIEILLQAMGIGAGDEVIVPSHSWISTSEAVSAIGATPVFVDTCADYTIDVTQIEAKITAHTKCIIPVHLTGLPADMGAIMAIAKKHNLKVMEDCAQSHGAMFQGKMVGTFGDCASFSFYPGKNLGAYGDAGCMATNDDALAAKARMIANHGQLTKHDHRMEGRNSRLDALQAAILSVKLPHLAAWTKARQAKAARYIQLLSGVNGVTLPIVKEGREPVWHLFVIQVDNRSKVMEGLKAAGIETAVHYPTPLPNMPCYEYIRAKSDATYPVATGYCGRILSLPIYPEITEEQMVHVVETLKKLVG